MLVPLGLLLFFKPSVWLSLRTKRLPLLGPGLLPGGLGALLPWPLLLAWPFDTVFKQAPRVRCAASARSGAVWARGRWRIIATACGCRSGGYEPGRWLGVGLLQGWAGCSWYS